MRGSLGVRLGTSRRAPWNPDPPRRPRARRDRDGDDEDRRTGDGQGARRAGVSVGSRWQAARRNALYDDDAGGAGGSRHLLAAGPPLSLRGESSAPRSFQTGGPATRIRSSISPSARSQPAPICRTTRPFTARPSRLWHRSRSGFCSLSATQSGRSRNSGRCPPTSTLRHGYRTTTSRDAPM